MDIDFGVPETGGCESRIVSIFTCRPGSAAAPRQEHRDDDRGPIMSNSVAALPASSPKRHRGGRPPGQLRIPGIQKDPLKSRTTCSPRQAPQEDDTPVVH
ncbi:unnamed protein product [Tenebrio molitor]|nr:unnamed protein product [Tenebrio molitor]